MILDDIGWYWIIYDIIPILFQYHSYIIPWLIPWLPKILIGDPSKDMEYRIETWTLSGLHETNKLGSWLGPWGPWGQVRWVVGGPYGIWVYLGWYGLLWLHMGQYGWVAIGKYTSGIMKYGLILVESATKTHVDTMGWNVIFYHWKNKKLCVPQSWTNPTFCLGWRSIRYL